MGIDWHAWAGKTSWACGPGLSGLGLWALAGSLERVRPAGFTGLGLQAWACEPWLGGLGLRALSCGPWLAGLGLPARVCRLRFAGLGLPAWACQLGLASLGLLAPACWPGLVGLGLWASAWAGGLFCFVTNIFFLCCRGGRDKDKKQERFGLIPGSKICYLGLVFDGLGAATKGRILEAAGMAVDWFGNAMQGQCKVTRHPVPVGRAASAAPCAEYRQNMNLSIHRFVPREHSSKSFSAVLAQFPEDWLRSKILSVFPMSWSASGLRAIPVLTVQSPRSIGR